MKAEKVCHWPRLGKAEVLDVLAWVNTVEFNLTACEEAVERLRSVYFVEFG